jgi:hypothetical protein
LLEGRARVPAVHVLCDRRVDEVEDVDIEVHREGSLRQRAHGLRGGGPRRAHELSLRDDSETENVDLPAFPGRRPLRIDPQVGDPFGSEQRSIAECIDQFVDRARQRQRMCDAHPVEGSIGRALGSIQVEVPVEVHQAGLVADLAHSAAHAQGDRAVAAEHQQAVISR